MEYTEYVTPYWEFCEKQNGVLKPYDGFMYFYILDRCFSNNANECKVYSYDVYRLTNNTSRMELNRSLAKLHILGFIELETKVTTNNSVFTIKLPVTQVIRYDKAILFIINPVVYIAFNPKDNLYKIGVTTNILDRGKGLKKYGNQVRIFAWFNGSYSVEKELHKYFDSKRVYSEWFSLDESDLEYIYKAYEVKTISYGN